MKHSLLLVGALCITSLTAHAKSPDRVDTIVTNRGKVYEQCRILQVDPDGVMFTHRHGGAKILFSELPPDMQLKLGYDRNREAEYEKSQRETRRAKQVAMWEFRKEMARLQTEAQAVEASRLQLEAAQAQAATMGGYGYGYGGYGFVPDILSSWSSYDPGYGYGHGYGAPGGYYGPGYGHGHGYGYGYGHGPHAAWYHARSRSVLAPADGTVTRFRSVPPRYYPPVRSVPLGVPAMGPLSPSMSPRTGNPGSIFPSR